MVAQLFNIALTAFYVLWLCASLWFLWRIWQNSVQQTQRMEQALIDTACTGAEAAKKAADAAMILAQKHVKSAE